MQSPLLSLPGVIVSLQSQLHRWWTNAVTHRDLFSEGDPMLSVVAFLKIWITMFELLFCQWSLLEQLKYTLQWLRDLAHCALDSWCCSASLGRVLYYPLPHLCPATYVTLLPWQSLWWANRDSKSGLSLRVEPWMSLGICSCSVTNLSKETALIRRGKRGNKTFISAFGPDACIFILSRAPQTM